MEVPRLSLIGWNLGERLRVALYLPRSRGSYMSLRLSSGLMLATSACPWRDNQAEHRSSNANQ